MPHPSLPSSDFVDNTDRREGEREDDVSVVETDGLVAPFPNLLSEFVFTRTYSRWLDDLGRRERWTESVDRYIKFIVEERPSVPSHVISQARAAILKMEVMPSMRAL